MSSAKDLQRAIVLYVAEAQGLDRHGVTPSAIQAHVDRPRPSVNRALAALVESKELLRLGAGRAISYVTGAIASPRPTASPAPGLPADAVASPEWSAPAHARIAALSAPLGTRKPVTYQRAFVDDYVPNVSSLLPAALASELLALGKSKDQQPAGTYARRVLEPLLMDLSWSSSRLEGNRKSWLETQILFQSGQMTADDRDALMLLNHKDAIEFMVEAVPTEGITVPVVRNLQSMLMNGLMQDPADVGAIRHKVVHIEDTVYLPSQVPGLLEEMLHIIVEKARQIRNPIEGAFFLWVNIAYLQPFADGNKRTSRLSSNMPLMLANCAPLSFLGVEQADYAKAMMGVYERLDTTVAAELFSWTYRRSIEKYQIVVDAMGKPDPVRQRNRIRLAEAIRQIVGYGVTFDQAVEDVKPSEEDAQAFKQILSDELGILQTYNCARYQLSMGLTQKWIDKGRPR